MQTQGKVDSKRVAQIVSFIFGIRILPFILLPLVLLKSGLSNEQLIIIFPLVIFFQVFIPISYIYFVLKTKRATSWDLPIKEERKGFLIITLISCLISLSVIYFFGNTFLFRLGLAVIANLVIVAIITKFWKISFHASLVTITAILLNSLYNWQFIWLLLLIPLVFWARLRLGEHDIFQLLAGAFLSVAIFLTLLL